VTGAVFAPGFANFPNRMLMLGLPADGDLSRIMNG
jgi:hypothetical protein